MAEEDYTTLEIGPNRSFRFNKERLYLAEVKQYPEIGISDCVRSIEVGDLETLDINLITKSVLERIKRRIEVIMRGDGFIATDITIDNISYLGFMSKVEFNS
jgi:hypothetical protein